MSWPLLFFANTNPYIDAQMKFLPEEHLGIVNLLAAKGLNKSQFSFRKKHGKLHLELLEKNRSFCFYRKTESTLTSNMQFEDKVTYFYGLNNENKVNTWPELIAQLEKWLETI